MLDRQAVAEDPVQVAMTTSGARIAPLSEATVRTFLARLDQPAPESVDAALGAFEEGQTLIGVAALGDRRNTGASLTIVIVPARRKLKIGSDLLHAAVAEAASSGVKRLLVTYPEDAAGSDALFRSSSLLTARRRVGGEVTTVLLVPAPS